jgi:hypothetical protein
MFEALAARFFWSEDKDTGFLSRRNLEQIDLGRLSVAGTGAQAVLNATRCRSCALIAFKAGASLIL